MDVVSAISSIIALVQLADRIVDLSSTYIGLTKGAEREIGQIITTIAGLKGFLEFLERFIKSADADRLPALLSQCQPNGPLDLCTTMMEEIESKLKAKKMGTGKALVWPFERKDIVVSLEFIEKHKSSLSLAMQGDTLQVALGIEPAVRDIQDHVHTQAEKNVLKWLYKVDPFANHAVAHAKWEPGTGEWFVSSHEFTSWMLPGRSLWLHGIPGAGKTVLSSTIIESLKARLGRFPICFYFDFRDPQKQSVVNMLYSLLAQLSETKVPEEVQRLYKSCAHGNRDASVSQLKETFLSIAKRTASEQHTTYVVVDALDECGDRETLMRVIAEICQSMSINFLTTSRQEEDISSALGERVTYAISIQTGSVDADINTHIQACLEKDSRLRKWDGETKKIVAERLTYKASGM
jgi:ankyrin repeat domain-containing protein 50